MSTILYNLATRNRPEQLQRTLDNLRDHASVQAEGSYFYVLIKIDSDDEKTISFAKEIKKCYEFPIRIEYIQPYGKIHAINAGIDQVNLAWDILVNLSDDMVFTVAGFDGFIRKHCGPDSFVHFPDDYAADKISTMSVIGRKYYQRDGYVYHNSYKSLWCDNEATEVAKMRGRYKYVPVYFIKHLHWANGMASKDESYRKNDTYHDDMQVYYHRKEKNFGE